MSEHLFQTDSYLHLDVVSGSQVREQHARYIRLLEGEKQRIERQRCHVQKLLRRSMSSVQEELFKIRSKSESLPVNRDPKSKAKFKPVSSAPTGRNISSMPNLVGMLRQKRGGSGRVLLSFASLSLRDLPSTHSKTKIKYDDKMPTASRNEGTVYEYLPRISNAKDAEIDFKHVIGGSTNIAGHQSTSYGTPVVPKLLDHKEPIKCHRTVSDLSTKRKKNFVSQPSSFSPKVQLSNRNIEKLHRAALVLKNSEHRHVFEDNTQQSSQLRGLAGLTKTGTPSTPRAGNITVDDDQFYNEKWS